jgi:hypothetical protein
LYFSAMPEKTLPAPRPAWPQDALKREAALAAALAQSRAGIIALLEAIRKPNGVV